MSTWPDQPDTLADRLEAAHRQARVVRRWLHDAVLPALPPRRRSFAEHIVRQIDRGTLYTEPALRDLEALIALLDREVAAGTHRGWEADEHHVRGGWETLVRDDRAAALASAVAELDRLRQELMRVLDAAAAARLMSDLTER